VPPVPPAPPAPVASGGQRELRQIVLRHSGAAAARADADAARAEADSDRDFAQLEAELERQFGEGSAFQRMIVRQFSSGEDGGNAEVITDCDARGNAARPAQAGRRQVVVCEAQVQATALSALKSARSAVAKASMPEDARAEALREIDREIARMSRGG